MNQSSLVALKDYLNLTKGTGKFIIPNYQRGYVWGQVPKRQNTLDSVTNALLTLLNGFKQEKDIFMQGITIENSGENIVLVDGQQRTTFFYLLLKTLGYNGYFEIRYGIRETSNQYLKDLTQQDCLNVQKPNGQLEYQDIYFFQKTLSIINQSIPKTDFDILKFTEFILNHVKFRIIRIPSKDSTKIFTMMNGNKAEMKAEELIKAELLRRCSLPGSIIQESENSVIRSRFAREWDKWLYWWRQPEVKAFFNTDLQLGWLLPLLLGDNTFTFDKFKDGKLTTSPNPQECIKEAKAVFKEMRLLQKLIEDSFYVNITHNYLGAILCMKRSQDDKFRFLRWYYNLCKLENKQVVDENLRKYFYWTIIDVNHEDIVNNDMEQYYEHKSAFLESLQDDFMYRNHFSYEVGSRWLLRCNIEQDNLQSKSSSNPGRPFDFAIWSNRSLEHIFPKSKVWHWDEQHSSILDGAEYKEILVEKRPITIKEISNDESYLGRDDIQNESIHTTEHSIGNLVLLYGRDNSAFGNKTFDEKKNIFFEPSSWSDDETKTHAFFYSRHLIRTISVFAHSQWKGKDIANHKQEVIEDFNNFYSNNYEQ